MHKCERRGREGCAEDAEKKNTKKKNQKFLMFSKVEFNFFEFLFDFFEFLFYVIVAPYVFKILYCPLKSTTDPHPTQSESSPSF